MTPDPTPKSIVRRGPGSLLAGLTYPLQALRLFRRNPRLRRYVFFPILVNLLVGGTIYATLLFAGLRAIDNIIADVPNWTGNLAHLSSNLPPLPEVSLPEVNLPEVNLPEVSLPNWQISLPDWLPHWKIALPDWSIALPDWRSIDWKLPGWRADRAIAIANALGSSFLWVLRLLLVLILLLVTGFIFLQFGVLLGSPWYGKLSEELELLKLGKLPPHESGLGGTVRDSGRAILYELKKLAMLVFIGLPLLLFNFLPGIGTAIASTGYLTLTTTIVCLDFLDSALERRHLRFRQKLGVVFRSLPGSASFGLVCLTLVSVPLINLLAIPVCVAAGTLFFCDRIQPWLDS